MPYTKQDCLDKIQDISTNLHSCFTALTAKGVTVPADASLDDLGGLIRQIPDASHPDYELPWVMTDGSTCVWLPTTMGKARSFAIECELAPTGQSSTYIYLLGASASNLSNIGLMYHDTNVQASRKLMKSVGQSGQTADVDNNARVSWPGWPFYKKQTLACGFYSTSGYRSSLQYNRSWTHAGTSSAQQSSSGLNDVMVCLFSQARYSNTGLTSPYTSSNCPAGTKVYGIKRWSTLYSDITTATETKICLHWDPLNKEYRPCFRYDNANNYEYSSFPKTGKLDQDGTLYYIDVTKGYQEVGDTASHMSYSGAKEYRTGIPHESGNVYVLQHYARTTTEQSYTCPIISNYNYDSGEEFFYRVRRIYTTISYPNVPYQSEILQSAGGSYAYIETSHSDRSVNKTYNYITAIPADSSNSSKAFATGLSLGAAKSGRSFKYGTPSGYIRIYYKNSTEYVKFLAVYNNGVLRHYLVPIRVNGAGDVKYYDVVTKTLINPQ